MPPLVELIAPTNLLIREHTLIGRWLLRAAFLPVGIIAVLVGLWLMLVIMPISALTRADSVRG